MSKEWRVEANLLSAAVSKHFTHATTTAPSAFMGGGGNKCEESEENVENLRPFRENILLVCYVFYFQTRQSSSEIFLSFCWFSG